MHLSPQQSAAVNWINSGSGSIILEAVAGAGKTTTLVQMLASTEGSVAFCAYNKAIANEIATKVEPLGLGNRVSTGTCHSFGFSAIRKAFPRAKVDGRKLLTLAEGIQEDMRQFACSTVSMAKQIGIGALNQSGDKSAWYSMVEHHSLEDLLPEHVSLEEGLQAAYKLLTASNNAISTTIDFDDMIYAPVLLGLKLWQNDWVLLDEAQDTNTTRRALVRMMLKPKGRLVAVGDPHQAIYGFTGADHDSLNRIAEEFNAGRMPLTVTYRCPRQVVNVARQWVDHITAHETAPEGEVSTALLEDLIEGQAFGQTDAILCRNTRPLVELAYRLIRRGTACRVEGRSIGEGLIKLASRWKVKTISALRNKVQGWAEKEIAKAQAKGQDSRCSVIEDQAATLGVLMDVCKDDDSISVLVDNIRKLFGDSDPEKGQTILTLSTIHKSKGREWDKVFALGMSKYSPSKWARKEWELLQEKNLCYVQVTRAKKSLVLVEV